MDASSDVGSESPAEAGGAEVCDNQVVCDDQVVRDDAADFPALRDAAKARRGSGAPLKIIDAGKLPVPEVEWLGRAGAEIYSSDAAGRSVRELILVSDAARKGGASASYFHHGPFAEGEGESSVAFADLLELGRSGLHLYASNAKIPRDFAALDALAYACEKSGSTFAYYHHGALAPGLEDLVRRGVWIHVHVRSLASADDAALLADCARAARPCGAGVVLHMDELVDPVRIADLMEAGVHILFLTPPSDYRSPVRPLEEKARLRPLAPRSYFLYPDFML
jgi:hypothetical protein